MRIILLITFLLFNAFVQAKDFADWTVDHVTLDDIAFIYTNTSNESDDKLGVMCIAGKDICTPYLSNGLTCEKDGEYPALVQVDGGLLSISMSCLILSDRYLFALPDSHQEYLKTNNKYSIAFGVKDGKFKATYFSLNGSAKAIDFAMDINQRLIDDTSDTKKSDYSTETL